MTTGGAIDRTSRADAVAALAGHLVGALGEGVPTRLADFLDSCADGVAGLWAVRLVGADAFAPHLLAGRLLEGRDAAVVSDAFEAFPPVQQPVTHQQCVLAHRDQATAELLVRLTDGRCAPPGTVEVWENREASAHLGTSPVDALLGPAEQWARWSVAVAQLSPLALPGLDGPVFEAVAGAPLALARGTTRAVLRRDYATAARLVRWVALLADRVPLDAALLVEHLRLHAGADARLLLDLAIAERVLAAEPVSSRPALPAPTPPVPSAPTAVVHDVASRAMAWLHAHHELGAFTDTATADLDDPNSVYKPLCEVALASAFVLREGVAGAAQLRHARELLDFSWEQMRRGDLLYERQLRHALLTDPVETYASFARSGYRHAALERVAAHSSAADAVNEVVPNRRLAVANAHRVVGIPRDDDWDALTAATWLGREPEPWVIDWYTGYCATHTVFHLTDWGARPEGLPAGTARYLDAWLPVWIDVWTEARQWDLVGELLLVGACLPEPRIEAAEWAPFAAAQHEDGLVPRDGEPVSDDPRTRFLDHQHTAVVATAAGTLALSRLLAG
ncbi:DUF6895 family protein [Lentzea chajnantorensis]